MRKKAILLLLCLPFIIAIFAFVTSTVIIRSVETDITGISWSYKSGTENPFSLSQKRTLLEATPVYDERYPLSEGNELVWSCLDPQTKEASAIASIEKEGEESYLVFHDEGICRVECANEKGNVSDYFLARIVGDSGAIIITPSIPFSSQSLSGINHVGLYDTPSAYQQKRPNSILAFDIEIFGTTSFAENEIRVESSPNVAVDLQSHEVEILEEGEATITFVNPVSSKGNGSLTFQIEEAMNVYDYEDLMQATNDSEEGIPIVLRKNLLDFDRAYQKNTDGTPVHDEDGNLVSTGENVSLFGRRSGSSSQPFQSSDLYAFETTYDHTYLDLWNAKKAETPVSLLRYAAVHIQKDFYGNGFEINLHDLCYPSQEQTIVDSLGNQTTNAILGEEDLYRGPLLYVSLGDPNTPGTAITKNGLPIFALYGQDNVGFYVEGDGILLDDVHFTNASNIAGNLTNLAYAGTVVEIDGNGIQIKDSVLEKGRNVLRSYSSQDLTLDNCLLQNGMEFLVKTGSNEFNEVDDNKEVIYEDGNGVRHKTTAKDYLAPQSLSALENFDYKADSLLSFGAIFNTQANEFVGVEEGAYDKEDYASSIDTIAESLTNTEGFLDASGKKVYKGSTTIKDCFFYNSGISALFLDTIPQGSFLYSNVTSLLSLITGMYFGDVQPSGMARTSYPVLMTIEGDTRFYDWKKYDDLSFESLLLENIAALILAEGGLGDGFSVSVTEDDYLPLKKMIKEQQSQVLAKNEGTDYLNLPIFFNGGGYNGSDVILSESLSSLFDDTFSLDPYLYSLDLKQDPVDDFNTSPIGKYQAMKIAMLRAASNITGFHPYRFTPLDASQRKWLGQAPSLSELQGRA